MKVSKQLQEARDAAKEFSTIIEFMKADPKMYCRVRRAKDQDVAFSHMTRIRVTRDMYGEGRECTQCKQHKSIDMFYKVSSASEVRRSVCKVCCNKASAKWTKENPEAARRHVLEYAKRTPETARRMKARARKRAPEAGAARDMLKRVLSLTGQKKTSRTEKALGYTAGELRTHIESQFASWMSWENWGEWHIDHIDPVAVMVRRGETRPDKINALSNLRPISAKENLSKTWEARGDNSDSRAAR